MTVQIATDLSMKTRRLWLRPYRLSDFSRWRQAQLEMSHPQSPFDRGPLPHGKLSKTWFSAWIRRARALQKKDILYLWGIFDLENAGHLGTVDIFIQQRLGTQCGLLGYAIHNFAWRRGYATEAVKAALGLAFDKLKLHRLEAGILTSNRASMAVAKKAGMKFEGLRPRYFFDRGLWRDAYFFSAISEDLGFEEKPPLVRLRINDYL